MTKSPFSCIHKLGEVIYTFCVPAPAVAVDDCAADGRKCLMCISYCGYAKIRLHVVCHGKSEDSKVITVKDGRNSFVLFFLIVIHLWYQSFRMFGAGSHFTINIRHKVEVVKGIFYIRMPHIAHEVREHCIYILSIPEPSVHICINKMMPKIICADAYS